MLLLSLISAVSAQDCPSPLSPDAMSARLDQVKEGVLFGEPAAGVELTALEAELLCLSGPVDRVELARLMLTRGAYELFLGQDGGAWFARAAALSASSDPDFGDQVELALAQAASAERATLVLDFDPEPAVLVLDGEVRYTLGALEVSAGWHLLQWLGDDGWQARVLEIPSGQSERVAEHGALLVVELPPDVATAPAAAKLEIGLGAGYQVLRARLKDSGFEYAGVLGSPVISMQARTLGTWQGRLGADLVSVASGTRSGATNRLSLAGGWQQQQGLGLAVGAGVLFGGGVSFGQSSGLDGPDFERDLGVGALLYVAASPLDVLDVELQARYLGGGVGGHLGLDIRAFEIAALPIFVRWSGDYWSQEELGELAWVQLGLGTRVSF